jgi:anti-sigma regulatory factor (Ser/Thr protein kinase)
MHAPLGLQTTGNRLSISGQLGTRDFRRVLAAMHKLTTGQGYQDIELDFTGCTAAYGGPILAIAAQTKRYLIGGLDVDLILPKEERLNRLFLNANWANLIDPRRYDPGNYRGFAQIPVMQFRTGQDQYEAVTLVTEKILSALSSFDRNHLKAIEWSLNEITDNVINHAQSPIGGLVQITNFGREQKAIEFCVCDAGIGIPTSLRSGHQEIRSDQEALDKAIREGVTRDKRVGQGNGLYGSWRITQISGGSFEIHAGNASLSSWPDALHIRPEVIPVVGSLVVTRISYGKTLSLEEALKFGGKSHDPVDYVQVAYEEDEEGLVIFPLAREAQGFGSRSAAMPVRQKLKNLLRICDGKRIGIDFSDVPIISSSFADEVFGKLFVELGALGFMKAFEFRKVDSTIQGLINRSIEQRAKTGL